MTPQEMQALADGLIPVVRAQMEKGFEQERVLFRKEIAALELRLMELETRPQLPGAKGERGDVGPAGADGRMGVDGKDGAPGINGKDGADGLNGKDGIALLGTLIDRAGHLIVTLSDGTTKDVGPVVGRDGVDGMNGKDGRDGLNGKDGIDGLDGKDGAPGLNGKDGLDGVAGKDGADGLNGKDGRDGIDGKDGAIGLAGKDGRDGVDGKDGAPGLNGKDGADGLNGKDGRDGIDGKNGADGLNGKDGVDGLNGKDGAPGLDGKDVDMAEVSHLITRELALWPRPKDGRDGIDGKDGADGRDGVDGVGFDDMDLVLDETKGWVFRFMQGDRAKDFPIPIPFFRGNWEAGKTYPKAAGVRWEGHFWWALRATSEQPGDGANDWQLVVSRGLRGKEGKQGKEGRPGRDLTQLGHDGSKW